ncbi:unnamed protein product [Calypogeia fissa]
MAHELAFDHPEEEKKVSISLKHSKAELKVITPYERELDCSEEEKMVSEPENKVTIAEEKIITVDEKLPEDDSCTAVLPLKRTLGDISSETAVAINDQSSSPTKRQKKDVLGEQEMQHFVTQGGNSDAQNEVIAEADEDVGGGSIESIEPVTGEQSVTDKEGGTDNAGNECRQKRKSDARLLKFSCVTIGEEGRDECRRKAKSDPMLLSGSDDDDDGDADRGTSPSSSPSKEPSKGSSKRSNLPSVLGRQQEDRELQIKIHRVENDYYHNKTSREVYNEERTKLYTGKEMREKGIFWPRREVHSPAGFREDVLENAFPGILGNQGVDDLLFQFACDFDRDGGMDEEAAKKRWMDEIEGKFQDPEAKAAEYKRWEKIREVETEYRDDRIDRDNYNERRFTLYTEEEREANDVVWPSEKCHSPAGYRDEVLEDFMTCEVDWETRMEFHLPIPPDDSEEEENLCELCIPAVKIEKLKKEEEERRDTERMEASEKKMAEERAKRLEAESRYPCAHCDRKFASELGRSQHTAVMHKDLVVVPEKKENRM